MILNTTVRPGLLVTIRTSVRGNVSYKTLELGTEVVEGVEVARWDTERTTRDKAEQERATKARSAARSKVQGVCIPLEGGGLLCPQERAEKLTEAEAEASRIVREFNDSAELTRIGFTVITGTVAPDDARAIRAINQELRELMESMADGMRTLDVEKIREAANRATKVTKMLPENVSEAVQNAIETARATARDMKKAAEIGAAEVDQAALARIMDARTAFLDLDETAATIGEVEHAGRTVELAPQASAPVAEPPAQARMFEV